MKSGIYKSISLCMVMVMLAGICVGCGKTPSKIEPTEETTRPIVQTQETAPTKTPAEKATAMYKELLETYPNIVPDNIEVLDNVTLGYEENLSKFGMHYDYFSVVDLNRDGIPELVASTVINTAWTTVSVFEYNEFENQLYLLKDPLDPQSHATFEQRSTAGGDYFLYICKDGHLHNNWGGDTPIGFQEENHAYVLDGENGLIVVSCEISNFSEDAEYTSVLGDVNDEAGRNAVFGN